MSNSNLRQHGSFLTPLDLTWTLHNRIRIAYSQSSDGATTEEGFQNWTHRLNGPAFCYFPQQEHGQRIVVLDSNNLDLHKSASPKADGFATALNLALGVWGSDCPGLVISCGDGVFGVAHCGWRGTAKRISWALIEELERLSPVPRHAWEAFIGPGICQNCYEVDEPVLEAYPWPAQTLEPSLHNSHRAMLNLKGTIRHQLEQSGIGKIIVSEVCTAEDPRMHSFRYRGRGPNQGLMAWPVMVE